MGQGQAQLPSLGGLLARLTHDASVATLAADDPPHGVVVVVDVVTAPIHALGAEVALSAP